MVKVTVKPNQTVYDIAIEQYGTCDAVEEILTHNPQMVNDDGRKVTLGIDPAKDSCFYLDIPVKPGSVILIDTDSRIMKKTVIREMETEIVTYN